MDSFFHHLLSKKRVRLLFVVGVPFFMLLFFANVLVSNLAAAPQASAAANDGVADLTKGDFVSDAGEVAGTYNADQIVPTFAPAAIHEVTPTPAAKTTRKSSYTIAVFGDSMVDTMGERMEYLEHALKAKYPKTTFKLYNYGVGSQNVEEGIARFGKEFRYQSRTYTSLPVLAPDIVILGSFSYNPFSPYDRNKHWLALAKLIQEAKRTGADVYMLAEIAPLRSDFGKGPNGVNWDQVTSFEHSGEIIEQLENTVGLAKNENVILINAFEKSIVNNRREGKKEYVNPSDGIHPSVKGHEFIAKEIVETLVLDY